MAADAIVRFASSLKHKQHYVAILRGELELDRVAIKRYTQAWITEATRTRKVSVWLFIGGSRPPDVRDLAALRVDQ